MAEPETGRNRAASDEGFRNIALLTVHAVVVRACAAPALDRGTAATGAPRATARSSGKSSPVEGTMLFESE